MQPDRGRPGAGYSVFEAEDLTFRYPGQTSAALDRVSVRIPAGSVTVLVGRSGSGKSTLLYLLGLLWDHDLPAGRIAFHPGSGYPSWEYHRLSPAERARLRGRWFGFVPESLYLLPQLSCLENVALPLLLRGESHARATARAAELLSAFGGDILRDVAARHPDALSRGQAQMLALARAIVHDPLVVFADEPTAMLDAAHSQRVLDLLCRWQQGVSETGAPRTLLLVLHDLEEAWRRGQYFLVMRPDHTLHGDRVFTRGEQKEEFDRTSISPREGFLARIRADD